MLRHKKNKAGLQKKIPSVFKGVAVGQNDDVQQLSAAPGQQRAQHGFIARFRRKKAKAMAKMEERLKAESLARAKAEERLKEEIESRASIEQKVKAEAEKMLLAQYRNYSVMTERAEAQAKKKIAAAKAEAKEAVEKAQSYAEALSQVEQKLTKAQEQAKTEAIARAKAEEGLLASAKADAEAGKAESKERQSLGAQAKEDIAAVKAQAEEKIRSYAAALAQAEEKLTEAKEKARAEAIARVKTEEGLLASAKADAEAGKAESKEPKSLDAKPPQKIKTFKLFRRHLFHLKTAKRKFVLFLALAILSAIALTFGVSVVNDAPVAEPGIAMTQEEKPVPITLMGSDPDGGQITYNIVKGPSYGSLSGTAPDMTYTPASNYNGPDSFTFNVNDGKANSDEVMISVTVLAVNDAPIANPQSKTTKENKSLSAALAGSDVDGDPLIFIICKEPEHGTLTLNSGFNTNGRLIYKPLPNFTGPDIFTFKLNDGEAESAPATVSINVAPNLLPVAEAHSVTTVEDTPVEIRLMGSDPDADPLAYSLVTYPSHGSLNGTAPNFTYTPNTNFHGSDSFIFKTNDSAADSAPATVSIMVSSVNDPPVANDDTATTREDTPVVTIDVLANDTDVDNIGRYLYLDTFSVTAVSQGTNGSVTINPDNTLSYKPNENFYGSDTFTYTISDGKGLIDTAKVNITVKMVNDAPVVTSASVTKATAGALYTYDVDAEDPDLGDVLTYSLSTKPADMTINSTTGLIHWKPTNEQIGNNEQVVVKVADSNSTPALDTQSFTIKVNPPPPKIAKLTVLDGFNQRTRKTLSAEGKANLVQSSDDNRWSTIYCSYVSFDFSDVSIPPSAVIKSVVVRVEHFEEEGFAQGKLDWAVGTGWPTKPVIWASIKAPVHEEEHHEAVDSWDVTSVVDTREKINSLQLQVKNNDKLAKRKTLTDYIYVLVEWD